MTQLTPGRIAALVAGVPVAVALVGWTSYNFVALAGTKTIPVSAVIPVHDGGVSADVTGGDLVLKQGQVSTARLTGTEQYSLFRPVLTVTQAGASTSVGFRCRSYTGNCALNATLEVPASVGVTLETEGGDASVPAFAGSLSLNSQGGDLTAGRLSGNVQLQTGGGNVNATLLSGQLTVETSGGDLNATTVSGDSMVTAGTSGGNVNVQDMADGHADITSDGGDVTVTFTVVPANLVISSGGGNITVVLPPDPRAKYNLQANAGGGSYTNTVPVDAHSANAIALNSSGGDISVTEGS
jgi:hypothetical protein